MRGASGGTGKRDVSNLNPEEENIINLLPRRPVVLKREKRHVSQHHGRVVAEARGRGSHATLGKAAPARPPSPSHYLKKRQRDQHHHALAASNHARVAAERPHPCSKRPPLPSPVAYPPPDRDRYEVNWIAGNVEAAAVGAVGGAGGGGRGESGRGSGRGRLKVDDLTGHTQDLLSAGLFPRYVFKKNFGRVPAYLEIRKKSQKTNKEEEKGGRREEGGLSERRRKEEGRKEEEEEEEYAMLPEEEKEELLKGLHANLREAQRKLQALPVVCETLASRTRRDQLEGRVTDLQRYIFLLQHHALALTS
ncbi:uncharacterized protein LOC127005301 [Eriocheir sinensis]|uniref:uncharacterized protein LOC127005301 n=1 Tax=Eriocheir sinensis TaxID=95602 RepID=UPI0021C81AE4|nr:uncharacterized protein LOC127005301 [Eriocheir sinensis]